MTEPMVLDRHTFYSALLLGLRHYTEDFDADGRAFHRAFCKVVGAAPEYEIELESKRSFTYDPVFGIVPEAEEMILEAEQDLLVALLNPRLRRAQFKIDEHEAELELHDLVKNPDAFVKLGKLFHDELTKLASSDP